MYTIYAISNSQVIYKTDVTEEMIETGKAVVHAITECEMITVMHSTGRMVSQEHTKKFN